MIDENIRLEILSFLIENPFNSIRLKLIMEEVSSLNNMEIAKDILEEMEKDELVNLTNHYDVNDEVPANYRAMIDLLGMDFLFSNLKPIHSLEVLEKFIQRVDGFESLTFYDQIDYLMYYKGNFLKVGWVTSSDLLVYFRMLSIPANQTVIREYFAKNLNKKFLSNSSPLNTFKLTRSTFLKIKEKIENNPTNLKINNELRSLLKNIPDALENDFLSEAILCYEVGAFRAAVVMTWNLTINHLHEYVLKHKLSEFNTKLALKNIRGLSILTQKGDFEKIKESVFTEICVSANIISKNHRKILDEVLGRRNDYAHPSTTKVTAVNANSYIYDLAVNIIPHYPL